MTTNRVLPDSLPHQRSNTEWSANGKGRSDGDAAAFWFDRQV